MNVKLVLHHFGLLCFCKLQACRHVIFYQPSELCHSLTFNNNTSQKNRSHTRKEEDSSKRLSPPSQFLFLNSPSQTPFIKALRPLQNRIHPCILSNAKRILRIHFPQLLFDELQHRCSANIFSRNFLQNPLLILPSLHHALHYKSTHLPDSVP